MQDLSLGLQKHCEHSNSIRKDVTMRFFVKLLGSKPKSTEDGTKLTFTSKRDDEWRVKLHQTEAVEK